MSGWSVPVDGLLTRVTAFAPAVVPAEAGAPDCERYGAGFWGQPVNSATSLAFVVAGVALAAGGDAGRRSRVFGVLVAATGVGSLVQHGPDPAWADVAHDLPLVALIAYVAVDAASDLTGRRLPAAWWVAPALAVVPVTMVSSHAGTGAQGLMAAVAVGLSLQRARVRPELRRALLTSMALLTVGALVGTLSRRGWPLCRPDALAQGHGLWHVMAAGAMWRLAPVVGRIGRAREGHASRAVRGA